MSNIETLCEVWLKAKKEERDAIEIRRNAENKLQAALCIPDPLEGTENLERGDFKIKVVGRLNRKVDPDKVQEIAAENGTTDYLGRLFRWKPEINLSIWKQTDPKITEPLKAGITTTPGRPSFTIEPTKKG